VFCVKLLVVLVPLLALYDVATAARLFTGDSRLARRILEGMGLSPSCGAPLLAGLFLGIAYGAGILIPASREGRLSRREVLGLCLFLCTCHAIPEDTLLFALVAAPSGWRAGLSLFVALLGIRLVLATVVARTARHTLIPRLEPEEAA